jgi:hypothetical protein
LPSIAHEKADMVNPAEHNVTHRTSSHGWALFFSELAVPIDFSGLDLPSPLWLNPFWPRSFDQSLAQLELLPPSDFSLVHHSHP